MNENDAIRLLANANPVRVDSLAPVDCPEFGDRAVPLRRLVLAAVVILALVAATATAVLGLQPFASDSSATTNTRAGAIGISPTEVPIPLSEASAALGAPVVLPDTSRIGPSDVGSVTKDCPGPWGKTCGITIRFFLTWDSKGAVGTTSAYGPTGSGGPTGYGVQIRYSLGGVSNPIPDYRAEGGRSSVIYLSGTPALLIPQNPNDTAGTASYIEFQLNGLTISVVERNPGGPTAQSIAQSIVDRSK